MKLHLDQEAFRVLIDTIHTQKGTKLRLSNAESYRQ